MDNSTIARLFLSVAIAQEQRRRNAYNDRDRIDQLMEDGQEAIGERVTWTADTADALINLLVDKAEVYRKTNPADTILVEDMMDALGVAMSELEELLPPSEADDEEGPGES